MKKTLLLKFVYPGADPTIENENGHKPEAYARNPKIVGLLQKSSEQVASQNHLI